MIFSMQNMSYAWWQLAILMKPSFFSFPESRCGLGSGWNEQSSACFYSATDYSSATLFEYAILHLKDKKKHSRGSRGQLTGRCGWINAGCSHVSPCFFIHRSGSGTSVPSSANCRLRVCGFPQPFQPGACLCFAYMHTLCGAGMKGAC